MNQDDICLKPMQHRLEGLLKRKNLLDTGVADRRFSRGKQICIWINSDTTDGSFASKQDLLEQIGHPRIRCPQC